MKCIYCLPVLFLFIFSSIYAQESVADFQIINGFSDCSPDIVCFEIQVKRNQANQSDGEIALADVNYRLFYPNNIMTFASATGLIAGYFDAAIDEFGPLGDEVLDLFGEAFDGPDGLGFLDFTVQVDGNSNAVILQDQWLSTVELCFNPVEDLDLIFTPMGQDVIVSADLCTQIIWSLPEYNGQENLYRFSYLTATEVQDGGGNEVDQLTEEVFHYEWAEDNMAFPADCEIPLCVLLPIELSDFDAKLINENDVKLQWTTVSEINSDYFRIERRAENENEFVELGEIKAAAFSSNTIEYEFLDRLNSTRNRFYYRLKMVDLDGTFKYSEVKSIYRESDQSEIKLFPNPTKDRISLSFDIEQSNSQVEIEVYDYTGKQILEMIKFDDLEIGNHTQVLPLSNLANGMYSMKINVNGKVEVQLFQVQQ